MKKIFFLIILFLNTNIFTEGTLQGSDYAKIIDDYYSDLNTQFEPVEPATKLIFLIGLFYVKKYASDDIYAAIKRISLAKLGINKDNEQIFSDLESKSLEEFINSLNNTLQLDMLLDELAKKDLPKQSFINLSKLKLKNFLTKLEFSAEQIMQAKTEVGTELDKLKQSGQPKPPKPDEEKKTEEEKKKEEEESKKSISDKFKDEFEEFITDKNTLIGVLVMVPLTCIVLKYKLSIVTLVKAALAYKVGGGGEPGAKMAIAVVQTDLAEKNPEAAAKMEAWIRNFEKAIEKVNSLKEIAGKLEVGDVQGALIDGAIGIQELVGSKPEDVQVVKRSIEINKAMAKKDTVEVRLLFEDATGKKLSDAEVKQLAETYAKTNPSKPSTKAITELREKIENYRKLFVQEVQRTKGKLATEDINKNTRLNKLVESLDRLNKEYDKMEAERIDEEYRRIKEEADRLEPIKV